MGCYTSGMTTVQPGIYEHFKGKSYLVLGEFEDTETGQINIAYKALYGNYKRSSRSKENFTEHVDRPDFNYKGPRFFFVQPF